MATELIHLPRICRWLRLWLCKKKDEKFIGRFSIPGQKWFILFHSAIAIPKAMGVTSASYMTWIHFNWSNVELKLLCMRYYEPKSQIPWNNMNVCKLAHHNKSIWVISMLKFIRIVQRLSLVFLCLYSCAVHKWKKWKRPNLHNRALEWIAAFPLVGEAQIYNYDLIEW